MKSLRLFAAIFVALSASLSPSIFAEPANADSPSPGLTAEVYDVLGQDGAPYIPQGQSPVIITTVPNISFDWDGGSVLGGPSEDVIVRFTGYITSPTTQDILFSTDADDGTRLYIDGNLIADDWQDKGGGGSTSSPVSFVAGVSHSIEFMYYENGGGARAILFWDQQGGMSIVPSSAFTTSPAVVIVPPEVLTVGAPTNLTVVDGDTSTVLNWNAPSDGTRQPERYAVNFTCDGCNGWGVATGNVGGANSLNTSITINHSVLESLKPSGTVWTFTIRSDNDTLALYSPLSNAVTLKVGKTADEIAAALAAQQAADAAAALAAQQAAQAAAELAAQQAAAASAAQQAAVAEAARLQEEAAAQIAAALAAQQAANAAAAEAARIAAEQAAAAQAAAATTNVPAPTPPVEPPAEESPAEEPPAEEPPVVEPPAEEPPVVEPPAEEPPVVEPPAEEPPAEEPPAVEPPAVEPPAVEPPAEEPPAEEPPAEEPPAEEPPAEEQVTAIVDDALSDGNISADDAEAVMDVLSADGVVTSEEVNSLSDSLAADGTLTTVEKELVIEALVASVAPGETLTKEQIQDAGIQYKDLPAETPVEVRQDENGNEVIIVAEVAAALQVLESPSELIGAIFDDPGQVILAVGSIGADMSTEEREEATDMVVATVVAAGAAINAVGAAAGAAGGSSSGGGSGGGGGNSGGGGSSGESKGVRRRKP